MNLKNISKQSLLLVFALSFALVCGCNKSNNKGQNGNPSNREVGQNEAGEDGESEDKTMMQKANELFQKAKESGATTAKNAKEWMTDMYGRSVEAGEATSESVANWVNNVYEKAKETGSTSAKSAKDWVAEDLSKIGAWQYTSRTVSSDDDPNKVMILLNELGAQKWECFWVDKQPNQTVLYFKKSPKSLLKHIPFKDLVRMIPSMGGGDESSE